MTVDDVRTLREAVSRRLPPRRFRHVLGVEQRAVWLARRLCPSEILRLSVAALLHDVTKDVADEDQPELCRRLGVAVTEEEARLPAVLHAASGAFVARRDFGAYCDAEILSAIRHHTIGDVAMPLFTRVLMLADFTEPTRRWERCKETERELLALPADAPPEAQRAHFERVFLSMLRRKAAYVDTLETPAETTARVCAWYAARIAAR
ncbi:MAG: bis(5'-nucleosyl)-tetraphosphatase (symmetrical) YqeK [Clostridia bacterium]|nr:bis(5'-nucleosyl)-tetraphosphatase (symmetrical) YqeK [Clostridia bacterium]